MIFFVSDKKKKIMSHFCLFIFPSQIAKELKIVIQNSHKKKLQVKLLSLK